MTTRYQTAGLMEKHLSSPARSASQEDRANRIVKKVDIGRGAFMKDVKFQRTAKGSVVGIPDQFCGRAVRARRMRCFGRTIYTAMDEREAMIHKSKGRRMPISLPLKVRSMAEGDHQIWHHSEPHSVYDGRGCRIEGTEEGYLIGRGSWEDGCMVEKDPLMNLLNPTMDEMSEGFSTPSTSSRTTPEPWSPGTSMCDAFYTLERELLEVDADQLFFEFIDTDQCAP